MSARGVPGGVVAAAVLLVAVVLAGCSEGGSEVGAATQAADAAVLAAAAGAAATALPDTITVTGTGSVKVVPDQAVMQIGVVTRGPDAAKAADDNAAASTRLMDALKQAGVSDDAIQTSRVTISPDYEVNPVEGREQPRGFRADNSVTVTLTDVDAVGKVFAAAAGAGANEIYGPNWTMADPAASSGAALEKAVAVARGKAESLAKAGGVSVGEVLSLSETGSSAPRDMAERAALDAASVAEPPVSPGDLTVSASVSVTYRIDR